MGAFDEDGVSSPSPLAIPKGAFGVSGFGELKGKSDVGRCGLMGSLESDPLLSKLRDCGVGSAGLSTLVSFPFPLKNLKGERDLREDSFCFPSNVGGRFFPPCISGMNVGADTFAVSGKLSLSGDLPRICRPEAFTSLDWDSGEVAVEEVSVEKVFWITGSVFDCVFPEHTELTGGYSSGGGSLMFTLSNCSASD